MIPFDPIIVENVSMVNSIIEKSQQNKFKSLDEWELKTIKTANILADFVMNSLDDIPVQDIEQFWNILKPIASEFTKIEKKFREPGYHIGFEPLYNLMDKVKAMLNKMKILAASHKMNEKQYTKISKEDLYNLIHS